MFFNFFSKKIFGNQNYFSKKSHYVRRIREIWKTIAQEKKFA